MSDDRANQTAGSQAPAQPPDMTLALIGAWLDDLESKLDEARERARLPDDIPHFITRHP